MQISASVEKNYLPRKDGLYQEVISHFVHFKDVKGNVQTKLDKQTLGGVYRESSTHNSFEGVVIIKENNVEKRLVAVEKMIR